MNGKVAGKSVNGKSSRMGAVAAWCALLMLVATVLGSCTANTMATGLSSGSTRRTMQANTPM